MPIGILTDEDFEKELEKLVPSVSNNGNGNGNGNNGSILGRNGKKETPESARKLIGELAIEGNDVDVISKEFNISPSSISAYKNGATSTTTYNKPDESLKNHVDGVRGSIVSKANKKILLALRNMHASKFEEASLKDLAVIAKDMSSVVEKMSPKIDNERGNNGVQFHIHVPAKRLESEYEVIDVT